jgi:hypothetical protein
MGFLKRRLVDRENIMVKGRQRKFGKQYVYWVSKQGEQYVLYLLDRENVKSRHKEKLVKNNVVLPDSHHLAAGAKSSEEIEIYNRLVHLRKKGYRRFPIRLSEEIGWKYLVARRMLRERGVKDNDLDLEYIKSRFQLEGERDKNRWSRLTELLSREKEFVLSSLESKELRHLLSARGPASVEANEKQLKTPLSSEDLPALQLELQTYEFLSKWLKEGQRQSESYR